MASNKVSPIRERILVRILPQAEKARSGEIETADIDEQTIATHLDTTGMPDPDLLIRTAGEMRISNFLLWQISYAEIWVTELCWPEFDEADHLRFGFQVIQGHRLQQTVGAY